MNASFEHQIRTWNIGLGLGEYFGNKFVSFFFPPFFLSFLLFFPLSLFFLFLFLFLLLFLLSLEPRRTSAIGDTLGSTGGHHDGGSTATVERAGNVPLVGSSASCSFFQMVPTHFFFYWLWCLCSPGAPQCDNVYFTKHSVKIMREIQRGRNEPKYTSCAALSPRPRTKKKHEFFVFA